MTINAKVLRVLTKLFSSGWTWFAAVVVFLGAVVLYELSHPVEMEAVNDSLWIMTSLITFFGYGVLFFYVLLYGLVFAWLNLPDGTPNVGGRLIFSLSTNLAHLVLFTITTIFFFPTTGRAWYIAPEDPMVLLPTWRFLVYTGLVVTLAVMAATLVKRIIKAEPLEITVPARSPRD